jgi:hypothetical protein
MRRARTAAVAIAFGIGSAHARAQTPRPSAALPARDTIVLSTFDLYHGGDGVAGQAVTLDHTLRGVLAPSHFRVSRFPDFHDAAWQAYTGPVPRWRSPRFDGTCAGNGVARLVAYFQVRAPRPAAPSDAPVFTMSNVARDTACVVIGGS